MNNNLNISTVVTGSNGFIGGYVVKELLNRNHNVIVMTSNPLEIGKKEWNHLVKVVPFNLKNSSLNFDFDLTNCNVIHLAWPNLPNYHSLVHIEENLYQSYFFIKNLCLLGAKKILITGTCQEYGMQAGALKADFPTNPQTSYAVAKDSLHKLLRVLTEKENITLQWARLFYTYGQNQNPNSFFSKLESAIKGNEQEFKMSKGDQLRDYLPVEDMATQLVDIILDKPAGVFNVCSGNPISMKDFAEQIKRKHNSNIKLNLGFYPIPDYEPTDFWGIK